MLEGSGIARPHDFSARLNVSPSFTVLQASFEVLAEKPFVVHHKKEKRMKTPALFLLALMASSSLSADELSDVKKENESLKREVAELRRQAQKGTAQNTAPAADRKAAIRARYEEDRKTYSGEQLREIEQLYQAANRDLKSPEAKKHLNALIEKYPKANRTGCAVQYMGQMSTGAEKEKYLRMAISDFGDCYYGSGVQVGAYARLYLAYYYKELGKEKEAKALFDEIRKDFPDAVNHKGKPLVGMLPK